MTQDQREDELMKGFFMFEKTIPLSFVESWLLKFKESETYKNIPFSLRYSMPVKRKMIGKVARNLEMYHKKCNGVNERELADEYQLSVKRIKGILHRVNEQLNNPDYEKT